MNSKPQTNLQDSSEADAVLRAVQGGHKADDGKVPMELLSPIALESCAKVLGFGAKKYAAHNWRKGIAHSRITGAILRHLFAYLSGEDLDPESGLPHVDHLLCEAMFLSELVRTRPDLDDRYKADK